MKFSGKIGFWLNDVETKPGVFGPNIVERPYTGDVIKNIRRFQSVENQQNENLHVNNRISIICDLFMLSNYPSIKYVSWNGARWKASSVDITSYPRVVIELGGVYNGKGPST